MLTENLNWEDLNNLKMKNFDGTAVYAQNKRQQVRISSILYHFYDFEISKF